MSISEQVDVISVTWFSEMGQIRPIGVVLAQYKDTGLRKAFIGTGTGVDEQDDIHHIIECGGKLYQSQVQNLNNEMLTIGVPNDKRKK